jgi:hypothetical protein
VNQPLHFDLAIAIIIPDDTRQLRSPTPFPPRSPTRGAGKTIQVLWPDTGVWYNAKIEKVNTKKTTATLYYTDSMEREEINLLEAILKQEVSWTLKGAEVGGWTAVEMQLSAALCPRAFESPLVHFRAPTA